MREKNKSKTLGKLAGKVLSGRASEAEKRFLKEYYDSFEKSKVSDELSKNELDSIGKELEYRLSESLTTQSHSFKLFTPMRIAASVVLLMLIGTAGYLLHSVGKAKNQIVKNETAQPVQVIAAGGNKAVLTLADGSKVVLDNKEDGILSTQAGVNIAKTGDGALNYEAKSPNSAISDQINILETPRGGIFQLTLADGTRVWLNSASRIKYPVSFSGKERRVELEGEAYFEVAHRDRQPFRVISKNQTIEVLGTHFNISTYPEQIITQTTLLQGSVKVIPAGSQSQVTLRPGQESATDGSHLKVRTVDTDLAVAWKDGLFRFDNDDIQTIMNKISRWYDVDVVYLNDVEDVRFGGSVSRFSDIEKVLNKLELTNTIHFRIEGRKIFVKK